MVYITEGEWTIGQENEVFNVKKDNVLILGGNLFHHGILPCKEGTETLFIHAEILNSDGFTTSDEPQRNSFIAIDSAIDVSSNKKVKSLFLEIISAKNQENSLKASSLFDLLLCELAETSAKANSTSTIADQIKKNNRFRQQ